MAGTRMRLALGGAATLGICGAVLAAIALRRAQYPLLSTAEGAQLILTWAFTAALGAALPAFLLAVACSWIRETRWRVAVFAAVWGLAIAAGIVVGDRREDGVWSRLGPAVPPPDVLLAPSASALPPNLVLVTIDTLRADHLSVYGYPRRTSPFLEELAKQGVVFDTAISQAPATERSMASLTTGLQPRVLDAVQARRGAEGPYLAEALVTLAERLDAAGYATGGIVSNVWLKASNGFSQGFDHYREDLPYLPVDSESPAAHAVSRGIEWARSATPPFFLWVHIIDPHHPYVPAEPGPWEDLERHASLDARYAEADLLEYTNHLRAVPLLPEAERSAELDYLVGRYDAEILQVDRALGELHEALTGPSAGERSTVFAVTSDHGEEFLDHGDMLHASTLHDEQIRVPLILSGAGIARSQRVSSQVRLIDLTATLLDLAGLDPVGVHGTSLLPVLRDPDAPDRPAVSSLGRRYASFRTAESKLIVSYDPYSPTRMPLVPWKSLPAMAEVALARGRREEVGFYDLASDPSEQRDLLPGRTEEARRVYDSLARSRSRYPLLEVEPGEGRGLTPSDAAALRALGYAE